MFYLKFKFSVLVVTPLNDLPPSSVGRWVRLVCCVYPVRHCLWPPCQTLSVATLSDTVCVHPVRHCLCPPCQTLSVATLSDTVCVHPVRHCLCPPCQTLSVSTPCQTLSVSPCQTLSVANVPCSEASSHARNQSEQIYIYIYKSNKKYTLLGKYKIILLANFS